MSFFYLLALVFAADVAALGSPDYGTRDAATRRLARWYPLSWPAVRPALDSADAEVRMRAGLVVRAWFDIGSPAWTRAAIRWVVYGPHEADGLPFASAEMHRFAAADERFRLALAVWCDEHAKVNGVYAFDPRWHAAATYARPDLCPGLDAVRFVVRGLPPDLFVAGYGPRPPWGQTRAVWRWKKKLSPPPGVK